MILEQVDRVAMLKSAVGELEDKLRTAAEELHAKSVDLAGAVAEREELRRQLQDRVAMQAAQAEALSAQAASSSGEAAVEEVCKNDEGRRAHPVPAAV